MTLATAATAILYLRGFRRLRLGLPETALRSKPPAFIGGLVVLWILSASPVSTLDHRLLTFHMLQHLLLMTIAAPLLLLGTPGVALLGGLPRSVRRAVVRLLRWNTAVRIGRALTWFWVTIAYLLPAVIMTTRS